jgi:hypothetical protein
MATPPGKTEQSCTSDDLQDLHYHNLMLHVFAGPNDTPSPKLMYCS